MKIDMKSGSAIAAAAATLLIAGIALSAPTQIAYAAKGHCVGAIASVRSDTMPNTECNSKRRLLSLS